jgi:hypothetical protein
MPGATDGDDSVLQHTAVSTSDRSVNSFHRESSPRRAYATSSISTDPYRVPMD